MHVHALLSAGLVLGGLSLLATAQNNSSSCHDYVLLDIRGTGEAQGPSAGFLNMTKLTFASVPNGIEYDVVYPAAQNQSYQFGSQDADRFINAGLQSCPNQVYAILGYSQGASATMGALMNYTDAESAFYKAIRAVVVIGNPYHVPNKSNDVDQNGTALTRPYAGILYGDAAMSNSTDGVEASGIPEIYYSSGKLLDICYTGDIICAPAYPNASFQNHLGYVIDPMVQEMGAKFLIEKLAANSSASTNSTSGGSSNATSSGGASSGTPGTTTASGSTTASASPSSTGAAAMARTSNAVFAIALGIAAAALL